MNCYTERIKKGRQLEEIYDKFLGLDDPEDGITIDPHPEQIVVYFTDLKDLSKARITAKSVFPDWTDKIGPIWNGCGDTILTSWECHAFPFVELRLRCNVKDYPTELLPDKDCTFEKIKETRLSLVCPVS